MRKRVILALLLVVALAVTSGCSLIVKDEAVDRETTIIEVAGTTIPKARVQEQAEAYLDYQDYMYYMYGMSFDRTSESAVASAREAAISMLIEDAVLTQKTAETGMDELTEEELAAAQESADSTWESYVSAVQNAYFADSELEGDELTAAVEAKLPELGYPGKDVVLADAKTAKAREKLRNDVIKDVAVTDDEVAAEYEVRKANAQKNYETNLAAYGTDVQNGNTVYYVPAGYRYVKHILVKIKDVEKINELQSKIDSPESELTEEELADLNAQLDAAKDEAYAAIQPMADEIMAKIEAGEDFDALMETYGEDAGMQTSPAKENGYLVCADSTNWVTEFKDAAMALENVGDVSTPVRTTFGLHIIGHVSDVAEGEVGLDAVKDTLAEEVLAYNQDDAYTKAVQAWVEEADAKVYADRMN